MNIISDYESSVPLPIGGETELECHERAKKGLKKLIQQLDDTGIERILLSGHAASVIAGVRSLMNDSSLFIGSGTCSLAHLKRRTDIGDVDQQWDLVFHGNCDHLSKGEQRSWMFKGDIPDYEKNELAN